MMSSELIEADHMDNDLYELVRLRSYLQFPVTVLWGTDVKLFVRLGDRVAVGFAKVLSPQELYDGALANKVLIALETAFSNTAATEIPSDRRPDVAILLLEHMLRVASDPEVQRNVNALIYKLSTLNGPKNK